MRNGWKTWSVAMALALLMGVALALLIAVRSGPSGRIVLAAGGADGAYLALARTYQGQLRRHGVILELREDLQGADLIKALQDPRSGIDGGIVKGGYMGALRGRLASAKSRDRHEEETLALRSLGRLMLEPVWVFTRGDLPIASLRDLEGKRILTGTPTSGSRRVAIQLLRANGVNAENSVLLDRELTDDAKALFDGQADAAILILPPESDRIQRLLRVDDIRLMDFTPEAQAYTGRFPALSAVVMHRASVEFEPVIPSADITLLATAPALIVRRDLHSSLTSLLAHAVQANPKSPFDKAGDPVLFHKAGQFPSVNEPEYEVADESRRIFKSGELPLLMRTLAPLNTRLGLPFSLTSFASSYGLGTILVLIPTLTLMLPLMRLLPYLYRWTVRQRLLYWYGQLKQLELRLDGLAAGESVEPFLVDVEDIDAAARRIRVPLEFSDDLYDLRSHIDLVRRRLRQWPVPIQQLAGLPPSM
jgi:TRAP-type uncharacterized transport system substrate-binding protein